MPRRHSNIPLTPSDVNGLDNAGWDGRRPARYFQDVSMSSLQGRNQARAWGGLEPPQKNIAPPNEMKPISPFGLALMFFARFHII